MLIEIFGVQLSTFVTVRRHGIRFCIGLFLIDRHVILPFHQKIGFFVSQISNRTPVCLTVGLFGQQIVNTSLNVYTVDVLRLKALILIPILRLIDLPTPLNRKD